MIQYSLRKVCKYNNLQKWNYIFLYLKEEKMRKKFIIGILTVLAIIATIGISVYSVCREESVTEGLCGYRNWIFKSNEI